MLSKELEKRLREIDKTFSLEKHEIFMSGAQALAEMLVEELDERIELMKKNVDACRDREAALIAWRSIKTLLTGGK